ncbi:MAG: hypothetical protein R3F53_25340 [Gammaproteobacteria bacterium]
MSNLKTRVSHFFEELGRSRVRQTLLQFSDRQLADAGFSRELLLAGTKAWPWRASPEEWEQRTYSSQVAKPEPELNPADVQSAIEELHAYSDQELEDLGLTRGTIEYAVRNGRPGFEENHRQAA